MSVVSSGAIIDSTANNGCFKSSVKSTFLPEIESLRGLAALAVVVEHSYLYTIGPQIGIFENNPGSYPMIHWLIHVLFNGRAAVVLFFVLSGMVLGIQLDKMSGSLVRSMPSFAIRRIFRIMPAMWVAIFFAYIAALLTKIPAEVNPALLIKTLFFQDFTLNHPLWSLAVEMVCSLIFPALYALNRLLSGKSKILLLLPLSALMFFPGTPTTLRFLVFFQVGMLVKSHGEIAMSLVSSTLRPLLFGIAFLTYAVAPQLWPFEDKYFSFAEDRYYLLLEIPACFILLSYVVYCSKGYIGNILRSGFSRYMGKISFSLYVCHYVLVQNLWPTFGKMPQLTFLWPYPIAFQTVFFVIIVCISIPVATIVYHFVELPFNNIGRKIGRWAQ